MVEAIVKKTIEQYELIKKHDRIVLGVSGGPDSMCMLYLLHDLRDEYKLNLYCAHFNHCLRPEADEEEGFVKSVCKDLHIPCMSLKKDVNKFFKGDSLEQTARNLRQDFFLQCTRQCKAKKIALAHNKDDVAETILMRIIRGTALRGLRGIMPKSKLKNTTIVRPLIAVRKKDILHWLESRSIDYRVDKSNLEEKFFRNKIRHRVLPMLEECNPNIINSLFNLGQTTALDYDLVAHCTGQVYNGLKKQRGIHTLRLDLKALTSLTAGVLCNVIITAIEELKGNTRKLELRHFQEIIELLRNRPTYSIVDLPDLEIKKEEKWLTIKSLLF